jgi:hypothetical protein
MPYFHALLGGEGNRHRYNHSRKPFDNFLNIHLTYGSRKSISRYLLKIKERICPQKICEGMGFVLLLCCVRVHCGIYKILNNISNISYLNSPPPPFSFILPHLPIPGIVSTDVIFPFTYMCT